LASKYPVIRNSTTDPHAPSIPATAGNPARRETGTLLRRERPPGKRIGPISNGSNAQAAFSPYFSWTDTYGVEIADGDDDVLILASTVVIDMVCHEDRKGD
jgi:hypothetical protein